MNITESLARIMFRGSMDLREQFNTEDMCILTPRLPGMEQRVTLWISEYDRERMVGEYDIVVTDLPTGANFRVRRAACALGCRCAAELVLDDPTPAFTDTERDAILCGLRLLQSTYHKGRGGYAIPEEVSVILTNNDEHYPITPDEIDDLCDLINPPVPHGGDEFLTGDGKRFPTFEAAQQHTTDVYNRTGVILAIEVVEPDDGRPRCPRCNSDDVAIDAAARWDLTTQRWALSDVHDSTCCNHCSYESDQDKFFRENNNG